MGGRVEEEEEEEEEERSGTAEREEGEEGEEEGGGGGAEERLLLWRRHGAGAPRPCVRGNTAGCQRAPAPSSSSLCGRLGSVVLSPSRSGQ